MLILASFLVNVDKSRLTPPKQIKGFILNSFRTKQKRIAFPKLQNLKYKMSFPSCVPIIQRQSNFLPKKEKILKYNT